MVDRMIAAGLADRQVNPDNRRETVLRVTPEGRRIVEDVTAQRRKEVAAVVERLDPAQRAALISALAAFTEAGGEPAVPLADGGLYPLGWSDTGPRQGS
jgi:DNA-binding MarR family transcriptional regulator